VINDASFAGGVPAIATLNRQEGRVSWCMFCAIRRWWEACGACSLLASAVRNTLWFNTISQRTP